MIKTSPFFAVGLCLLLAGCSPQGGTAGKTAPGSTTDGRETKSVNTTEPNGAKEPAEQKQQKNVELTALSWEEVQQKIASHQGKIVVLDAWSKQCPPCMQEFPNLVALHNRHRGGEVVCMSMSVDYVGIKNKPPEFYRKPVLEFLTEQNADFENFLLNQESDIWYDAVDLASIPAVFVYGRDGNLHKRFDNENIDRDNKTFTYEDVNKVVEELLNLPKPE